MNSEMAKARGLLGRGGWDGRWDGEAVVDVDPGDAMLNDRGCVGGVCA